MYMYIDAQTAICVNYKDHNPFARVYVVLCYLHQGVAKLFNQACMPSPYVRFMTVHCTCVVKECDIQTRKRK